MDQMILLCDKNISYITYLAKSLEKQIKGSGLSIRTFSDAALMMQVMKQENCALIITGEDIKDMPSETKEGCPVHMIRLTQTKEKDGIYKYQSATALTSAIVSRMLDIGMLRDSFQEKGENSTYIIGIYSPARSLMQSTIGMLTGQLMARDKSVLYINLEPCSGMEYLLQRELSHDLSDIMFYLTEHEEEFPYRLKMMVEKADRLDIVPPVFSYKDIEEMDNGEYEKLISRIASHGMYDVMIIDLYECRDMLRILSLCDKIFCPYQDNGLSLAKIDQYKRMLDMLKLADIDKKTKRIKLPEFSYFPGDIFSLTNSQIEKFIREEIIDG